jgi:hypothetical protein
MAERNSDVSTRFQARATGVVYLLFFATAIVGEVFIEQAGISELRAVSGDAGTIATNLLAHETSYRVGFALGLVSIACYVALVALAGLGWLTFLSPPLANDLLTYIEILGVLSEGLLMLWLLVMGVDVALWRKRAGELV